MLRLSVTSGAMRTCTQILANMTFACTCTLHWYNTYRLIIFRFNLNFEVLSFQLHFSLLLTLRQMFSGSAIENV